jgi:hypothetical protein
MRNRRKSSFNNLSLNIDELPIKRILLLAFLAYILMMVELFLLTSYRLLWLPNAASMLCGDAPDIFLPCVNEVINIMLFGGQWSAIKFSLYVFTLTPLFYLLMVRQKGSPFSNMLLLAIILLLVISATIKPPWAELAAVLTSNLLAGCFIKKRHDRLKIA